MEKTEHIHQCSRAEKKKREKKEKVVIAFLQRCKEPQAFGLWAKEKKGKRTSAGGRALQKRRKWEGQRGTCEFSRPRFDRRKKKKKKKKADSLTAFGGWPMGGGGANFGKSPSSGSLFSGKKKKKGQNSGSPYAKGEEGTELTQSGRLVKSAQTEEKKGEKTPGAPASSSAENKKARKQRHRPLLWLGEGKKKKRKLFV